MKVERMGWIVAAALAGAMVGMGFQDKSEKTGTVDIEKVFNQSEYAKKQTEGLRNMGQARLGVVDFIRNHRTMKAADAEKFRQLSLKENRTATDTAEMERLRTQAQGDEQKFKELSVKGSPSATDVTQLEDFNRRKEETGALLQKWNEDFSNEIQSRQENLRGETLQRVKDSVAKVAKEQGYSIIFVQSVAPYSANDITDAALKSMNSQK
jgi:Skp family chaperone for outer membrane proteins